MIPILRCLFIPLALSGATLVFAEPPQTLEKSFVMSSGAKYTVRLKQNLQAHLNRKSFQEYGYWGIEGAQPSYCASSFTVIRRNLAVPVRSKVFRDLCNVHSLELSERNDRFVVSLGGGDAADSFSAEFQFQGVYLLERMVRNGEFPESYERTIYRHNTYDK